MSPTTQAVLQLLEKHGDITFTDMSPHLAAAKLEVEPTQYNAIKMAWKKKTEKAEKPEVAAKGNTAASPETSDGPTAEETLAWVKDCGGLSKARDEVAWSQRLLAKAEELAGLLS